MLKVEGSKERHPLLIKYNDFKMYNAHRGPSLPQLVVSQSYLALGYNEIDKVTKWSDRYGENDERAKRV